MNYTTEELREKIKELKEKLSVTVVAHFYQRDEVFEMADIVGDSLELAKKTQADDAEFVLFCGVGFMGQSVKVLSPEKRVVMPKVACCAMARMIDTLYYDESVAFTSAFELMYVIGSTSSFLIPFFSKKATDSS